MLFENNVDLENDAAHTFVVSIVEAYNIINVRSLVSALCCFFFYIRVNNVYTYYQTFS